MSIVNRRYTKFLGLDTINDPTKFAGEGAIKLSRADNVNITRDFSIKRRDGYYLWAAGAYSSIWANGEVCYAVNGGDLVELSSDSTETVLRPGVGTTRMRFADTKDGYVYFTNGAVIGKIKNGVAYSLSGTVEKFKGPLQPGNFLSVLAPRLLVVKGRVLYISDSRNKDVYHLHQGFMQFDTDIRMVAPIGPNMFLSDSRYTYFMRRVDNPTDIPIPMFRVDRIANYPAIAGDQLRYVEGIRTEINYYPYAVIWTSEMGICIGSQDGGFENLTDKRYLMPAAMMEAYSEFRQTNDLNLFITTIKGV